MSTVRRIERIIKREGKVLTVTAEATVAHAARKMSEHQVGCLVVIDRGGKAVGIISERDIISKVVAKARDCSSATVAEAMNAHVIFCSMDATVDEAQQIMTHHQIRHLPIIENGVPVGMISSRDVMAHQLSHTRAIARRQSRILTDLERAHPGITSLQTDSRGRIVL